MSLQENTGSGAATNAGIDYQQRVSAWFLTMMFARSKISSLLGLPHNLTISSVAYENANHIDDLKLACTDAYTLYLQIKRRVSLSVLEQSDFCKTIDQFVRQFVAAREPKECYVLATSSSSSGAIKKTLKKLTEAYRLNPNAFEENPLSKDEQRVLTAYKTLVQELYRKHASTVMADADFAAFTKQVYINVLDVESGGAHETVAITVLAPLLRVSAELIWALLITNSLHYAKSRLSITSEGLIESLELYRADAGDRPYREVISSDEQLKLVARSMPRLSTGKEVVLVESFVPEVDHLILEFFRFDEQCNKRIRFTRSAVIWDDENTESKVICRMATLEGMRRFVEENTGMFKDKSFAIIPANDIEAVEETSCAHLHAELCARLLEERKDLAKCLHCGKALSQHWVTLVELDDSDTSPAVGGVHDECRRPVDRVLGRLQFPQFEQLEFLKYFDVDKWIECYLKGQGLFNGLKQIGRPITVIAWNPQNEDYRGFDYCIKVNLKDGTARYLTSRDRLDRYPKELAEARAAEMNSHLEEARAKNDPACYTSINWTFGLYSRLVSIKEDEEECVECLSAEAVRYTQHIGSQYPEDVRYYTPLLYLATGENESPFVLNNHLVFLTSPLDAGKILRNWGEADVTVGPYEMRIVESDQAFDRMVGRALDSGLGVVIDPLLDRNGQLAKGHLIVDMETAKRMGARAENKGGQ